MRKNILVFKRYIMFVFFLKYVEILNLLQFWASFGQNQDLS